jgi:hypothetical protein
LTLKPLFAPTARAVDQGRSHDAKSAMSALLINATRSIENQCTVEECHSFSFDQRAHGVLPRRGWTLRVLRNRGPAAAAGSLKRLQTFCQPGDCAVDRRCRPRVHGDDSNQKQQQWCTMRDDFTAHARRQSRVQHECSHECSHHNFSRGAAQGAREQTLTHHTPPLLVREQVARNHRRKTKHANMQDRRNGCLPRNQKQSPVCYGSTPTALGV